METMDQVIRREAAERAVWLAKPWYRRLHRDIPSLALAAIGLTFCALAMFLPAILRSIFTRQRCVGYDGQVSCTQPTARNSRYCREHGEYLRQNTTMMTR